MWPFVVVVAPPFLDALPGVFRHSARRRAMNASMNALSVGVPGREKSILTLFR